MMTTGALASMKAAEAAASKGLLHTARQHLERASGSAGDGYERAFAAYQLGAFYWGEVGDGVAARRCFEQAVTQWKETQSTSGGTQAPDTPVLANAAENMMLLSLSYEEFDRWTEELQRSAPQEPILHEYVPIVQEKREKGQSWAEVSLVYAMQYVGPNQVGGGGHAASGACLFRLLLEHRKRLRLAPQQWRAALLGYVAAMSDVLGRADSLILRTTGRRQPGELAFAHEATVQFLTEYRADNPSDAVIAKALETAKMIARQKQVAEAAPAHPQHVRIASIHVAITVLLIFLGIVLYGALPAPWNQRAAVAAFWLGAGYLVVCSVLTRRSWIHSPAQWRTAVPVREASRSSGIDGFQFRLMGYDVGPGGYLFLAFRPTQPIPKSKTRAAHMALRCVVALTLPDIVARMPGFRLVQSPARYTIGFGSGVTVPFWDLQGPFEVLRLLQVGSEVTDGVISICIHPSGGPVDEMFAAFAANAARPTQGDLGEAFLAQLGETLLRL